MMNRVFIAVLLYLARCLTAANKLGHICTKLEDESCYTIPLKYNFSSFPGISECRDQKQAREKLNRWKELKAVSACWKVLEPFLCQTYYPKCENGTLRLPCKSFCLRVQVACTAVPNFNKGKWPRVLRCENFPVRHCDEVTKLKSRYNLTTLCHPPLLNTKYKKNWFNGIQGCGLNCRNQLYTDEEHKQVHLFIAVFGTVSMLCNLFCVATFAIDWKSQSKYPARIIFYMNFCFLLSSFGWLLQFLGDTHRKIVCRSDGTLRSGEPGSQSGYGWCLLSFLLIYCFSFSGTLWFVMLSYAWHISFRTLGSTKDKLLGKTTYFHVLSWMIPVICTIALLIMEEVDGDSVFGICFIGYRNRTIRETFLLFPFGVCLFIGAVFLIKGTVILYKVKGQNLSFLNGKASTKITETIVRIGLFSFMSFTFMVIVFVCHIYESRNMELLKESLNDFVRCGAIRTFVAENADQTCRLKHKPGLLVIQLQVLCTFGAGIMMSSWIWTKVTLRTWRKAWIRFRGFDVRKKIQQSLNGRVDRRRIRPLLANVPAVAALAVPGASRAVKHRGSVISNAPSKQSNMLRITSFISGIADDIRSKLKPGADSTNRRRSRDFQIEASPLLIRPREGRRGTLLSIESILTASSAGKLMFRRGSMPNSATSGSEYGMAFGHMWSIKPQLNRPSHRLKNNTSNNLRVIRLGEDMTKDVQKTRGKTKSTANTVDVKDATTAEHKHVKEKKKKRSNKIQPLGDTISYKNILTDSSEQRIELPPLKTALRQRSPLRTESSFDIASLKHSDVIHPCYQTFHINKN